LTAIDRSKHWRYSSGLQKRCFEKPILCAIVVFMTAQSGKLQDLNCASA